MFQKGVDNFDIEHKTCSFLVKVQYPLNQWILPSVTEMPKFTS